MVYLDINKKNFKSNGKDLVKELDHHLGGKDNKVFILIFMEGCGPCNATRPEWKKMENVLNKDYLNCFMCTTQSLESLVNNRIERC